METLWEGLTVETHYVHIQQQNDKLHVKHPLSNAHSFFSSKLHQSQLYICFFAFSEQN